MSVIDRAMAADAMVFHLEDEERTASGAASLERTGRSARTLLKDGALRVTLIVLAPGGMIAEHEAAGPITVHLLKGGLRFTESERKHDLEAGDLLSLAAGIRHDVRSDSGATFLLTIGAPPNTHTATSAEI